VYYHKNMKLVFPARIRICHCMQDWLPARWKIAVVIVSSSWCNSWSLCKLILHTFKSVQVETLLKPLPRPGSVLVLGDNELQDSYYSINCLNWNKSILKPEQYWTWLKFYISFEWNQWTRLVCAKFQACITFNAY